MKDRRQSMSGYIPELEHVPTGFHNAVTTALEKIENSSTKIHHINQKQYMKRRVALPLTAALCLVIGTATYATASLYQQRMETMNQEMLDEFYAKASVGSGIRYSRVLTEDEQMRYEALNKAYEEEGVFPQGSVTYLKDYKDYTGKGIGLYADRSTLFLPENKLSDEELLQIIDLEHKISYSIEKINEDVNSGVRTDYPDSMQIMPSESDNGVIAYEGKVDVWRTTAGEKYLYLAGTNVIEKMPIGSSTSEPFYTLNYEDDMVVYAMEEDTQQGLYAIALYNDGSNYTKGKLLHIDAQGTLLYEKDWNKKKVIPEDVETDSQGRVYVQTFLDDIYVYDQDGLELLKWEIPYDIEATDSMCQAKDGNVYLLCEDEPYHSVLLRLNPDTGEYTEVATDMLETVPPHRHSLLKGKETDFVIWDYEGLYTYNIGDASAKKVMELYEAPLAWEDAAIVTLEDGRVVFAKAFDYDGKPVPESVRFCYVEIEKGDV